MSELVHSVELLAPAAAIPPAPVFGPTQTLAVLFLQRFPLARRLLHFLRIRSGYLYESDRWDTEYSTGHWSFLHSLDQAAHYHIIDLFRRRLKPLGAVLDIGCGEAILYAVARGMSEANYLGIDISESAIASAERRTKANARFEVASAESFQSSQRFDVVVFNESLYYCRDPRAAIEKYAAMLTEDGIFIVSMAICGLRDGMTKSKIWDDIAPLTETVAEMSLVAPSAGWTVKALRPKRLSA